MGLFSSIGKVVKSVTKPFSSFISGSGIGDLMDFGSGALGIYNDLTGNSAKQQMELMRYQTQLQNESWKYQMSNRHQLEVGDLRNAGLNPILSANSGGAISAGIPNGALADSDSARFGARTNAQLARQNAQQVASLIQTNATQQDRNTAEAEALRMNAESNRINALAGARRASAEAALFNQRMINERLYPANQPLPFKYLNSASSLYESWKKPIEDFFDRRYGPPRDADVGRRKRYEVYINGTANSHR